MGRCGIDRTMRLMLAGRSGLKHLQPSEHRAQDGSPVTNRDWWLAIAGLLIKVVGQQALGQELMLGVSYTIETSFYVER